MYTYSTTYIPYKLRNNIIQLDLAYCKPQDYNLTSNHKKFYAVINNHNIMLSNLAFVHIIVTTNLISLGINQSQTMPFSTTFE